MGAAGSVRKTVREEVSQLHEKALNREEEIERQQGEQWAKSEGTIQRLLSEKHQLADELRRTQQSLQIESDGLKRERIKATSLMFSELPLEIIQRESTETTDGPQDSASLTKTFPMVTFAQCDIAGFSSLASRLQPHEIVRVVNHFHTLIDQAFTHPDIFIMERTSSGCIVATGLVETYPITPRSGAESQLSMTDSSYGSEAELNIERTDKKNSSYHESSQTLRQTESSHYRSPENYASILAIATLQLMSDSTQIVVPNYDNRQLQLRIGLHSGACSAGVIGLQTSGGSGSRISHYKLFGLTLQHAHYLCMTGLALQIRVSKKCQELLVSSGGFQFERCPDYTMVSAQRPIESFWLVGRVGMELSLPSLELALPLNDYDDIDL